jgi:hypothetical protein
MMPDYGWNEELFASLTAFDGEMAQDVAAAGCPRCGGPLHQANYQRKPRGGVLAQAGEGYALRHSLCCGRRGCRRRTLPPSLRFLGRRVYLEAVVVFASVMAQLAIALRHTRVATGVPEQTLRRWGWWWRETFAKSSMWAQLRARLLPPPPEASELPLSWLKHIEAHMRGGTGSASSPVEFTWRIARCLAPMTTLSALDGSRFLRGIGT